MCKDSRASTNHWQGLWPFTITSLEAWQGCRVMLLSTLIAALVWRVSNFLYWDIPMTQRQQSLYKSLTEMERLWSRWMDLEKKWRKTSRKNWNENVTWDHCCYAKEQEKEWWYPSHHWSSLCYGQGTRGQAEIVRICAVARRCRLCQANTGGRCLRMMEPWQTTERTDRHRQIWSGEVVTHGSGHTGLHWMEEKPCGWPLTRRIYRLKDRDRDRETSCSCKLLT